jgi:hypothetical protein
LSPGRLRTPNRTATLAAGLEPEPSPVTLFQAGFRFQTTRSVFRRTKCRWPASLRLPDRGTGSRAGSQSTEEGTFWVAVSSRARWTGHKLVLGRFARGRLTVSERRLRGYFQFTNDWPTAIENFLLGTPTVQVTIGEIPRVRTGGEPLLRRPVAGLPSLSIYGGFHSPETTPLEVDGLTCSCMRADANNFAPACLWLYDSRPTG